MWVPVQNTGPGSLTFSGAASISGTNHADFAIPVGDDLCQGQTLAIGDDCFIGVQFTASVAAAESATLILGTSNAENAPTVTLNGVGVAPDRGPAGPAGPTGAAGAQGPAGSHGPAGTAGVPGQNGTNGTNGINASNPISSVSICTVRERTTTCRFTYTYVSTAAAADVTAVIRVDGRERTVGHGTVRHHKLKLTFTLKRLHRGRYTVTLFGRGIDGTLVLVGHTTVEVS
jgi:hypothetical protein